MRGNAPETRGAGAAKDGRSCPNCNAAVQDGDIVCVACGTNLITGQKVAEERQDAARRGRPAVPLPMVISVVVVALVVLGGGYLLLGGDPVKEAGKLSRDGRVLDAINVLHTHVEKHADDAEAQFLLGKLYWQSDQYQASATAFESANHLDPANAQAGLLAALAFSKSNDSNSAAGQLAVLKSVAANHPDNPQAVYLYALALGNANKLAEGQEVLEQVLEAEPGAAWAKRSEGIALALQGNLDGAAQALEEGAKAHPEAAADMHAVLGLVRNLQGETDAGAAELRTAIQGGTGAMSFSQARLGLLLMGKGDYENALPLLREAKQAGDKTYATRFFHALCLDELGLKDEALLQYTDIVDEGKGPFAADAAVQMARIYLDKRDDMRVRNSLRSATQLGGASARLHTVQGLLDIREGAADDAQASFRKAIAADPDYAPAHLESGLLRIRRGAISEGVRSLERYLQLAGEGEGAEKIALLVEQLRQTVAE